MKKLATFLVLALFLLAACRSNSDSAEPLAGSEWTLLQVNGRNVLPGTHVEITFDINSFSGVGGCNAYGGEYRRSGDSFSVTDGIMSTEMYCEPEELMDQERDYFAALNTAAAYQVIGGRMEMYDKNGTVLLIFAHQQEAADFDPEELAGTGWQVVNMGGQALIEGSQITLIFEGNGRVRGFAGCRGYEAEYVQTGGGTRFTRTSMTEEVCNDEDLLVQEGTFTDYFTWTERLELVGDTLILHAQTGEQVVFEPLEE